MVIPTSYTLRSYIQSSKLHPHRSLQSTVTDPATYPTMTKPRTCCGRADNCVCATQAKCSCGQQSALHCNCEKKATENVVAGPRCSCSMTSLAPILPNPNGPLLGARPAGECTCDRAQTENQKVTGSSCACGQRAAGKCSPVYSVPELTDPLVQVLVPVRKQQMEDCYQTRSTSLPRRD